MTISITKVQVYNLTQMVHFHSGAPVTEDELEEYIQKHQIYAALFADINPKDDPSVKEFYDCFKGYPNNIDAKLAAYAKKHHTEQRQKTDELVKADALHRGVLQRLKADQPVGCNQWLDSDDINETLKHLLPADRFLSPRLLSKLEAKDFAGRGRPLSVVTNPTGDHWTVTWMDEAEKIRYEDSMQGSEKAKQKIKGRLQERLLGLETADPVFSSEQPDGWSCGWRAIRKSLIIHGVNNEITRAKTSEEIRDAILKVMSELTQKPDYKMTDRVEKVEVTLPSGIQKGRMENLFNDIFQDQINRGAVKLEGDKVVTTDLSDESLEDFVKNTAELMKSLGLEEGEFVLNAPDEKKKLLEELCKKYGLKIAEPVSSSPRPT